METNAFTIKRVIFVYQLGSYSIFIHSRSILNSNALTRCLGVGLKTEHERCRGAEYRVVVVELSVESLINHPCSHEAPLINSTRALGAHGGGLLPLRGGRPQAGRTQVVTRRWWSQSEAACSDGLRRAARLGGRLLQRLQRLLRGRALLVLFPPLAERALIVLHDLVGLGVRVRVRVRVWVRVRVRIS